METMMNPLEQHDTLYRLAYKKFLDSEFELAQQLAEEAVSKAQEFYLSRKLTIPADRVVRCRAQNLLNLIEKQTLLDKK
ncbi:MAG: hypothetical protein WBP29_04465 [Candidatus Zixiibacteriota bacterium]